MIAIPEGRPRLPATIRRPSMVAQQLCKLLAAAVLAFTATTAAGSANGSAIWPEPTIRPLPSETSEGRPTKVTLSGTWKFTTTPPRNFWENDVDTTTWDDIIVPGEVFMQGHEISQDVEYPYKRHIDIPASADGKEIRLRFNGVYSKARVWLNGTLLRTHIGGFTAWDVNITDHVQPGETAILTVGITDRSDDISRASFYAKHNVGGILRDVSLVTLPRVHLTKLHIGTDLDDAFNDGLVKVRADIDPVIATHATLEFSLLGLNAGRNVIAHRTLKIDAGTSTLTTDIPVTSPSLWDAEHPNLYTLETRLVVSGQEDQVYRNKIGFREIEVVGDQMLVNGNAVKLRGINRHSLDPTLGRTETPEQALADIKLFRDANINFIRTSHYPPTREFLELADQYGLYVEVEAPITWWNPSEDSSPYTAEFMNSFSEMIEFHRNHPSVLMWSLGNESFWDPNFDQEFEYAKTIDPSRPLIWSFVNDKAREGSRFDIYANHYPDLNDAPVDTEKPVLFEEFAHVYSYDFPALQRDPNTRNFWGESIKAFWENMSADDGNLGGVIWSGIDEVFYAPQGIYGYGEWGLIDGWRRKKPEHWLTKKAYSPIRITDAPLPKPGIGQQLSVKVQNWFDHSNLSEIELEWSVGGQTTRVAGPDIGPRSSGHIRFPARNWADGDVLSLRFFRNGTELIDAYDLPIGNVKQSAYVGAPPLSSSAPTISESPEGIDISGPTFSIRFDKQTGQISEGRYDGQLLIVGGPFLSVQPSLLSKWDVDDVETSTTSNQAIVHLTGTFGNIRAKIDVAIDGAGRMDITYLASQLPDDISELGIMLALADDIDRLKWDRKALWSVYPSNHIGRPRGTASKHSTGPNTTYGQKPATHWSHDTSSAFLFGRGDQPRATRDFRSTKANLNQGTAWANGQLTGIQILSDGDQAIRMGSTAVDCVIDDDVPLIIYSGTWETYEDPGDCGGAEHFSNEPGASASMWFYGDTVKWIGSTHYNMGTADVLIDGVRVVQDLDLHSVAKIQQLRLYENNTLPLGWHEIKVVVTGKKQEQASDSFVVIDGFHASNSQSENRQTDMHVLDIWGYDPGWGNLIRETNAGKQHSGSVVLKPITVP